MLVGKKLAARLAFDKEDPRSATPANETLGRELFESGAVSLLRFDDASIVAEVGGGAGRPVGLTKDSGFQAGARRTYDIAVAEAWALMVSAEGNELLTGRRAALAPDETLSSWGGPPIAYEQTTYAPGSHLRMKWRESGRSSGSTLQLRVPSRRTISTSRL
jgi:hypothetical protein